MERSETDVRQFLELADLVVALLQHIIATYMLLRLLYIRWQRVSLAGMYISQ